MMVCSDNCDAICSIASSQISVNPSYHINTQVSKYHISRNWGVRTLSANRYIDFALGLGGRPCNRSIFVRDRESEWEERGAKESWDVQR
jgi:hypothetical protein